MLTKTSLNNRLQKLSSPEEVLELTQQFAAFQKLWIELLAQDDKALMLHFFQSTQGAVVYTKICRLLDYKDILLSIMLYFEGEIAISNLQLNVLVTLYQNWLWMAVAGNNPYYLSCFRKLPAHLDSIPSLCDGEANLKAKIDENLVCAFLKQPQPHKSIRIQADKTSNYTTLHYLLQEFSRKRNAGLIEAADYLPFSTFLLKPFSSVKREVIYLISSYFINQKAHDELYVFLSSLHTALFRVQFDRQYQDGSGNQTVDFKWQKELMRIASPLTKALIRLGLVLGKPQSVLEEFVRNVQESNKRGYLYIGDEKALGAKRLNKCDARMTLLLAMINNVYNPLDFKAVESNQDGEVSLHNAVLLMNPYNPEYSPSKALMQLMTAIHQLPELGDSYMEYLRCRVIMDKNYSSEKDPFIVNKFLSANEHYGFYWTFYAKQVGDLSTDLDCFRRLESHVRRNVELLRPAYDTQGKDPEVLKKYPVKCFLTAFGSPDYFVRETHANEAILRKDVLSRNNEFSFFAHPLLGSRGDNSSDVHYHPFRVIE